MSYERYNLNEKQEKKMREVKLNLGCGKNIREGWVNVDKFAFQEVDIIHDLNSIPYPFKDESVDHILLSHVLEHLNNPPEVLIECHHILKVGGILEVKVPHKNSHTAYSLYHKHRFVETTLRVLEAKKAFNIVSVNVKRLIPTPFGYIRGFNIFKNYRDSHICIGVGIKHEIHWILKKTNSEAEMLGV